MNRRSENTKRESGRSAFTLTEMLVSVASAGVLMVGLGSTMYLASRATSDTDRPTTRIVKGSMTISDIAAELHYAVSFIERSNHAVEFTIADRTGDGIAERIRYAWSGELGTPLTRRLNGAEQTICDSTNAFELGYTVQTIEELPEADDSQPSNPTEVLVASFDGWSGVTASSLSHTLMAGTWASEYFELPWPAGATSFRATRLRLKFGQISSSGQFSVGFYTPASGVGPNPSSTLLGSQQTLSAAGLPSTPDWMEFTFSDVTMSDPTSGYNIVVKGIATGARLGYMQSSLAPQDSTVRKYSTNSGASWLPSSASQEKLSDVNFELYGIFEGATSDSETEPVERYFVRSVSVSLQSGENAANRVSTAIDILNAPEVATP